MEILNHVTIKNYVLDNLQLKFTINYQAPTMRQATVLGTEDTVILWTIPWYYGQYRGITDNNSKCILVHE